MNNVTPGAFEIVDKEDLDHYNIKPLAGGGPVPEDQRKLQQAIYATRGVLKLLHDQGIFPEQGKGEEQRKHPMLKAFQKRILQIAEVGLTGESIKHKTAAEALAQVRKEIVIRKGKAVVYKYLLRLAVWACAGVAAGLLIEVASAYLADRADLADLAASLKGYGWVVMGAMVGAWLSVASARREITLADLPNFLGSKVEPAVRIVFVGLLAALVALFLDLKVMTIMFGELSLADFDTNTKAALLLGAIAGISEKVLSVRIIERAREIVAK